MQSISLDEPVNGNNASDNLSDREYINKGLNFWLNNNPTEAERFFERRKHRTSVLAGYSFVLCMNGVISYEMDKIEEAQKALKQLEKLCTANVPTSDLQSSFNWLSNVRYRIFGNVTGINVQETPNEPLKSPAQLLEEQIILGDTYMSMAILTFLTQDFAGLMKGSWLLRKAWKIYQKTYKQLYEMYIQRFGCNCDHKPPMPLNYSSHENYNMTTSFSYFNWKSFTNQSALNEDTDADIIINPDGPFDDHKDKNPSKRPSNLELTNHAFGFGDIKTCPTPQQSAYSVAKRDIVIDSNTLKHLMAASSFGYGLFQLTSSLLPAKLLKVISIFGFEGNRDIGVSCLYYARSSTDMRATLATLALLWFYTFGTQLFLSEDGYAREKIEAMNNLLDDCPEYQSSAIFLFFRGRLERMKADAQAATEFFRKSFRLSAQNELKLLCLHEIAWCALIQLDFVNAMTLFNEIRQVSVYSKAFYTYMTAICQGSIGKSEHLLNFKAEIADLISRSTQKQTHIVAFVQNRLPKITENMLTDRMVSVYLVYEMMFLWNCYSNISPNHLQIIIKNCTANEADASEPMIGLNELILGAAYAALQKYSLAINAYRQCIAKRLNCLNQDMHIKAFAHYELATLLIHCHKEDAELYYEAKSLLQKAQKCQNYDLENRLCVQIQQELKNFN